MQVVLSMFFFLIIVSLDWLHWMFLKIGDTFGLQMESNNPRKLEPSNYPVLHGS